MYSGIMLIEGAAALKKPFSALVYFYTKFTNKSIHLAGVESGRN
jgi:hypothetical protein